MASRHGSSKSDPKPFDAPLTGDMRVVILHGKEHFIIEAHTRRLAEVLDEQCGGVETFRFDGESVERAQVLDELRSYGLMQTHKLVILDSADVFLAGDKGKNRAAMERYVESPVNHATLLMRASTWRPGNLDKAIQKVGTKIKCDSFTESKATKWCTERAEKTYGVKLEHPAAARLVERLDTGLSRLDSEIAKLAASVDRGGTITTDLVTQMVGRSREEQSWDLQDAIVTAGPGGALTKLHELREISGTADELLMWSMIDLCRKLHLASQLLRQRIPRGTVIKQASHPRCELLKVSRSLWPIR